MLRQDCTREWVQVWQHGASPTHAVCVGSATPDVTLRVRGVESHLEPSSQSAEGEFQ